jgi:hypothetical protein
VVSRVCSCGLVDAVEQVLVEVGAAGLVVVGGMVALALQGGPELDGGGEESAAFADRFEGAVEGGGPGAPAVAEHPAVLLTEPSHGGGFPAGEVGVVVEGVDGLADGVGLVGDGAVGDAGVDERHAQGAVPEDWNADSFSDSGYW